MSFDSITAFRKELDSFLPMLSHVICRIMEILLIHTNIFAFEFPGILSGGWNVMDTITESPKYCSVEEIPLFLDAKDIVRILGISKTNVYYMFRASDFPTITIGKRKFVRKEKLFSWLDAQENSMNEQWRNEELFQKKSYPALRTRSMASRGCSLSSMHRHTTFGRLLRGYGSFLKRNMLLRDIRQHSASFPQDTHFLVIWASSVS